MKFAHILVEGETELAFANQVLRLYLREHDIELIAAKTHGLPVYNRVEKELQTILRNSSLAIVTTMFDFYGLPRDFPGRADVKGNTLYDKVRFCEQALEEKFNSKRFIAYLNLHEFEALLFSSPEDIAAEFPTENPLSTLKKISSRFESPEHINDSQQTAPSKRLLDLFPN